MGEGGPATKNFFMDIYAKEVSKMQSVSKSSSTAKKRNFDSTQFNTYGLPLGQYIITKLLFLMVSFKLYEGGGVHIQSC